MSPQPQREPRKDIDLTPLTESYELVAELKGGARENSRTFIGKRRDDGRDVLVFLVRASRESGDRDDLATSDRKSLTLFAADAKLLAGLEHRNMLSIVDSRWVGDHAFAVITERTTDPTLEEVIERSESLPSERVAEILRQVNGVLEWARSQTVTHRGVRPDTLFVEPGTDRVRVSFAMRPLPVSGVIEPETDAHTIAELAHAMLTRGAERTEHEGQEGETSALATLRPDLPTRVVEETERILRSPDTPDSPTDVLAYIALVAMADSMKQVEEETLRARAELEEEVRTTREALDTERTTFERTRDEETRKLDEERERLERQLVEEREKMQSALAKERKELQETLARDRNELQRTLTAEQERLATEREDLQRAIEKERRKLDEARAKLEHAIAKEREEMEAERAILERIGGEAVRYREETQQQMRELEERRARLAKESKEARERERDARIEADRAAEVTAAELSTAAMSEATELPMPEIDEPLIEEPSLRDEAAESAAVIAESEPKIVDSTEDAPDWRFDAEPRHVYDARARRKRQLTALAAAVGVVGITVAAALAAINHTSPDRSQAPQVRRTVSKAVVDSAAGGLALRSVATATPPTYASIVPLPEPNDSITAALAKEWKPRPKPRPKPKPVVVNRPPVDETVPFPSFLPQPAPQRPVYADSLVRRDTASVRHDTIVRRDTIRPRPDSGVRPPGER